MAKTGSIFNQIDIAELQDLRSLGVSSITLDADGTVTKVEFFERGSIPALDFDTLVPEQHPTDKPPKVDANSLPDGPYKRILKNGSVS
jgi:hypothetical protein